MRFVLLAVLLCVGMAMAQPDCPTWRDNLPAQAIEHMCNACANAAPWFCDCLGKACGK